MDETILGLGKDQHKAGEMGRGYIQDGKDDAVSNASSNATENIRTGFRSGRRWIYLSAQTSSLVSTRVFIQRNVEANIKADRARNAILVIRCFRGNVWPTFGRYEATGET